MPRFRETTVSAPDASTLLTEYFTERETTFPSAQGTYTTTLPDPGAFVAPDGVFVVVDADPSAGSPGGPVACGGVRRIAPSAEGAVRVEVKHLFVRPSGRGHGLGRAVLLELESRAAALGAAEVVLDTNDSLEAAGGLYRSAGYTTIEPYNANPNATTWYGKAVTATTPTGGVGPA